MDGAHQALSAVLDQLPGADAAGRAVPGRRRAACCWSSRPASDDVVLAAQHAGVHAEPGDSP